MEKLPDGRRPDGGPPDGARPEGERPHPRRVRPGRRERSVCVEGTPPPAPRSPSSSSHLLDPTRERPHRRRVRESPAGVRHPEQECPRPSRARFVAAPPAAVPIEDRLPPRRLRPRSHRGGAGFPVPSAFPALAALARPVSPVACSHRVTLAVRAVSADAGACVPRLRRPRRVRRRGVRRPRLPVSRSRGATFGIGAVSADAAASPGAAFPRPGPRSGRRRVAGHACRCRDPHGVTLAVHAAPAEVAGLPDAAVPPGRDRRRHCVCRSPGVHGAAPCSPPPPSGPGGPDHAAVAAPASRRARGPGSRVPTGSPFDSAEAGGRRRSRRRPRTTPAASAAPGVPPRLRPCCFRSAGPLPASSRPCAPARSPGPGSGPRKVSPERRSAPRCRTARPPGVPSKRRETVPATARPNASPGTAGPERLPPAPGQTAARPRPPPDARRLPGAPSAHPSPSLPPPGVPGPLAAGAPSGRPTSLPAGTLRAAVGPRPAAEFPAVGVPAPGLRRLTWGSAV